MFWRRTAEVKCHSHHTVGRRVLSTCHQRDLALNMTLVETDLNQMRCASGFPTVKVTLFFLLSMLNSLEGSHKSHLRSGNYAALTKGCYLHKFFRIVPHGTFVYSLLFVYSIIYVSPWTCGRLFYTLCYNPNYLIPQIASVWVIGTSRGWLPCPFDRRHQCSAFWLLFCLSTSLLSGTTRCSRFIKLPAPVLKSTFSPRVLIYFPEEQEEPRSGC